MTDVRPCLLCLKLSRHYQWKTDSGWERVSLGKRLLGLSEEEDLSSEPRTRVKAVLAACVPDYSVLAVRQGNL